MVRRWLDRHVLGRRTDRPLSTRRAVALATLYREPTRREAVTDEFTLPLQRGRHRADGTREFVLERRVL